MSGTGIVRGYTGVLLASFRPPLPVPGTVEVDTRIDREGDSTLE